MQVIRSTDGGDTFTVASAGLPNTLSVIRAFAASGNAVFAATNEGIYRTTTNGDAWEQRTSLNMTSLAASGSTAIAVTEVSGNFYLRSSDGFGTWTLSGLPNNAYGRCVIASGGRFFIGATNGMVYASSDNGETWTALGSALSNSINSLAAIGDLLYASCATGIYKIDLNTSAATGINVNHPHRFSLSQNYPNPFNPETVIDYQLATNNEVRTLVNERQSPSNYIVRFNAAGLASGIYFYTLRAGNFSATKKLTVLK